MLAAVGNRKFDGHRQRLDGFRERMEELGFKPRQILVAETFNDYETTYSVVGETLSAHPELRGIYMANLSAAGCAEAVRAAGRKGDIRVISTTSTRASASCCWRARWILPFPRIWSSRGVCRSFCCGTFCAGENGRTPPGFTAPSASSARKTCPSKAGGQLKIFGLPPWKALVQMERAAFIRKALAPNVPRMHDSSGKI